MTIIDVELRKDRLLAMSEDERTLFLALGHVANELNAITKMLYWSSKAPIRNSAEQRGQDSLSLLLVRLLAGKLNESWELLRTNFFGNALSRKYEPKLTPHGSESLTSLKRYFGTENAANQIRKNFAFHYSPAETAAALADVDEELHVYMEQKATPNNLFAFTEAVIAKAVLELLNRIGKPKSLAELAGEMLEVSAQFAGLIHSLVFAIIHDHGSELRAGGPQEVHFDQLEDFDAMVLPWFTDTSNILARVFDRPNTA